HAVTDSGRFLDEAGQPLSGATVHVGFSYNYLSKSSAKGVDANGKPLPWEIEVAADAEGRYKITHHSDATHWQVWHERGYAIFDEAGKVTPEKRLSLHPYAALSGRLMHRGKPVPGAILLLSATPLQVGKWVLPQSRALTDAEGRFRFDRVTGG